MLRAKVMSSTVLGVAALAAALLPAPASGRAIDAPAARPADVLPDRRNASPVVRLGDKTAERLCLSGFGAPHVMGQRS